MNQKNDQWLRRIMNIHFHPDTGTPYWLDVARQREIQISRDIQNENDLLKFGLMDAEAFCQRPIEDFIPRSQWSHKTSWIMGETGGTLGAPKTTIYRPDEFQSAFVDPFVRAATLKRFPREVLWLYIGPSGPHIIGKAARACAWALGSPDPFSIDFDPRWIKKFTPDSIMYQRYLNHITEQTLRIIQQQHVQVLFTTPVVLLRVAQDMSNCCKRNIWGIHLGGMSLTHEDHQSLTEKFPNAVILSGYGNTLFGMCPELDAVPGNQIQYFPWQKRLKVDVVTLQEHMTDEERLVCPVNDNEEGQVVLSRLDESFLILNMFERDQAYRVMPGGLQAQYGFTYTGIGDPRPLKARKHSKELRIGLY